MCRCVYNESNTSPLQVTKDSITAEGKLQAIIVNSGNANACTGMKGLQDAYEMRTLGGTFWIERKLRCSSFNRCNWCSAPMDIIRKGVATLIPTKEESEAYSFLKQF